MTHLFTENSLVYRIRNSNLYAVVGEAYLRDIRQYATEYQCLGAVPNDRQIKATVFEAVNDHLYTLRNNGRTTDLPVNQLEFDTGNLRLSA